MLINSPKIDGSTTTIQFFIACRMVACVFVSPFVRASSINSLVKTSVSSARVVRVNPAITPKESDITAGSILLNILHVK